MCDLWLPVISIVLYTVNVGIIMYAASRAWKRPRFRDFWVSSGIFFAIGTLLYLHIVSDCHIAYLQVAAAMLACDLALVITSAQIWLLPT